MFFKQKLKIQNIKNGSLVMIKEPIENDKSYYVVLNQITENNSLTEEDNFDDSGMTGIVWGIDENYNIKDEIYLRLWNHELKKFIVIAEKYLVKIND
jgi:hypothetical protein